MGYQTCQSGSAQHCSSLASWSHFQEHQLTQFTLSSTMTDGAGRMTKQSASSNPMQNGCSLKGASHVKALRLWITIWLILTQLQYLDPFGIVTDDGPVIVLSPDYIESVNQEPHLSLKALAESVGHIILFLQKSCHLHADWPDSRSSRTTILLGALVNRYLIFSILQCSKV
jgi:hypothetical protein